MKLAKEDLTILLRICSNKLLVKGEGKMKFKTYRLYRARPIGTSSWAGMGNRNSSLTLNKNYSPTTITFRGRSDKEAMKKANKFWQDGNFGQGSITIKEESET